VGQLGHSRKHPWIPPPQRKFEVNPPTPFGCPDTFTIIRNNFFSPPPPDGRNFLRGGSVDLFWNDPLPPPSLCTALGGSKTQVAVRPLNTVSPFWIWWNLFDHDTDSCSSSSAILNETVYSFWGRHQVSKLILTPVSKSTSGYGPPGVQIYQ
jgi:hypothetical protein